MLILSALIYLYFIYRVYYFIIMKWIKEKINLIVNQLKKIDSDIWCVIIFGIVILLISFGYLLVN